MAEAGDDEDAADMERVAREMIDQHGQDAERYLRERADIAEGLGDTASAGTWRDIADAVNRLSS